MKKSSPPPPLCDSIESTWNYSCGNLWKTGNITMEKFETTRRQKKEHRDMMVCEI